MEIHRSLITATLGVLLASPQLADSDAREAYKHVAARVASRAVTVSSIAAITTKSGQRVALKTEGSAYAVDAILGADGKSGALNVSVQRVARAVTKTASGNVEAGGVMYLGAVPAAKGGGQEILFLRMLLL